MKVAAVLVVGVLVVGASASVGYGAGMRDGRLAEQAQVKTLCESLNGDDSIKIDGKEYLCYTPQQFIQTVEYYVAKVKRVYCAPQQSPAVQVCRLLQRNQ